MQCNTNPTSGCGDASVVAEIKIQTNTIVTHLDEVKTAIENLQTQNEECCEETNGNLESIESKLDTLIANSSECCTTQTSLFEQMISLLQQLVNCECPTTTTTSTSTTTICAPCPPCDTTTTTEGEEAETTTTTEGEGGRTTTSTTTCEPANCYLCVPDYSEKSNMEIKYLTPCDVLVEESIEAVSFMVCSQFEPQYRWTEVSPEWQTTEWNTLIGLGSCQENENCTTTTTTVVL